MILFLEVAGLLILLVGKSVRRKNEMENVGDLKKKKRGWEACSSLKIFQTWRKTMCSSDPGEAKGYPKWPPESPFSADKPWRGFTGPHELTPNQALAGCSPPTSASCLNSFTIAAPCKPTCPHSSTARDYPWPPGPLARGLEGVAGTVGVGCAWLVLKSSSWAIHNTRAEPSLF